jgi:hypothetical protein
VALLIHEWLKVRRAPLRSISSAKSRPGKPFVLTFATPNGKQVFATDLCSSRFERLPVIETLNLNWHEPVF